MQTYESPKIKFQQLTLFEKIATTCWSANSAFYDINLNKREDSGEALSLNGGSCRSNNSSILTQMKKKLGALYSIWYLTSGAMFENILTNTMAFGILVDFTSGCGPKPTPTPTPGPCPPKGPGGPWWG